MRRFFLVWVQKRAEYNIHCYVGFVRDGLCVRSELEVIIIQLARGMVPQWPRVRIYFLSRRRIVLVRLNGIRSVLLGSEVEWSLGGGEAWSQMILGAATHRSGFCWLGIVTQQKFDAADIFAPSRRAKQRSVGVHSIVFLILICGTIFFVNTYSMQLHIHKNAQSACMHIWRPM